MSKFFLCVIVVIINLFLFQHHITAQDFDQQFLPEGAMKRLNFLQLLTTIIQLDCGNPIN